MNKVFAQQGVFKNLLIEFEQVPNLHELQSHVQTSRSQQDTFLVDLAYVMTLSERSYVDLAQEVLKKYRRTLVHKSSEYKALYFVIASRLYARIGKNKQAIWANLRAIEILEKKGDGPMLKLAYIHAGYLWTRNDQKRASIYLGKALQMEQTGESAFYLLLRCNLAFLQILNGNEELAETYLKQATRFIDEKNKVTYLDKYRVLILQASLAEMTGDLAAEELFMHEAEVLCLKFKVQDNLASVWYSQSFNAASRKEYALAYQKLLSSDSLKGVLPHKWVTDSLFTALSEDRISLEKQNKRIAWKHYAEKNRTFKSLLLISLLLLIGLIVIWFQSRKLKNNQLLLIHQNRMLMTDFLPKTTNNKSWTVDPELIHLLEGYVITQSHFRDHDLTLEKLAKKLKTNRSYLSESINGHFGVNFNQWLNQVRIHEAKKMLVDEKYTHYSIEGISQEVGFSSISSFNSAFKKETGLTPSVFRSSVAS